MYHASIHQDCRYENKNGLDVFSATECQNAFQECCNNFRDTKHCTKGITQALNTSFCPYVAWNPSPAANERISRSCCESCLKGMNDRENGRASGQTNVCNKRTQEFNSTIDFNVYMDCCQKRVIKSASIATYESDDAEAEAVIHSNLQAYGRRNLPQIQDAANAEKPCSELNTCAHYCIDSTPFIPKHCACKTGYFLAEDGGSCRSLKMRYSTTTTFRTGENPCDPKYNTTSTQYRTGGTVVPGQTISREERRESHSFRSEFSTSSTGRSPDSGLNQKHDDNYRIPTCGQGYAWNPSLHACADVDECRNLPSPCGLHDACINYEGGFYCRKVQIHHDTTFGTTEGRGSERPGSTYRSNEESRSCESGLVFSTEKGYCVDDDECVRGTHRCKDNENCRNTYRNYTCDCNRGYQKNNNGVCVDIDECSDTQYTLCPKHESVCLNTPGSYRCLCNDGFAAVGNEVCRDVDECQKDANICGVNGICINTYGSFKCRCQPGFKVAGDGKTCEDIDECSNGRRMCVGKCVNIPGSFRCTCPPGFKLDGSQRICEDIDECQERNPCHSGETCLNTMGDHRCYSINCPTGYYQDPDRENRCVKKEIKQTFDTMTQSVSYERNAPHYITYNHLTLACNLTEYDKLFYDFAFDNAREDYDFRINVVNVSSPPGIEPARNDNFRIVRKGRNGASIYLNKPIRGPQDIEIEFSVANSKGEVFYKSYVTIYVAKYDGVTF